MDTAEDTAEDTAVGTECKVEDPSLEVIKLLWMLINKHASDLNEGIKIACRVTCKCTYQYVAPLPPRRI